MVGGGDGRTSRGQPHRRVGGGNPGCKQVVPSTLSPRPLADASPRRAPDAEKSEAGARGRPSQGEGSTASADLEAGATRQGAGVSPDG